MACPVCRAAFRGTEGARDAAPIWPPDALAVRAWRLRQAARRALAAGEFAEAARLAAEAQAIQATEAGWSLEMVAGASG